MRKRIKKLLTYLLTMSILMPVIPINTVFAQNDIGFTIGPDTFINSNGSADYNEYTFVISDAGIVEKINYFANTKEETCITNASSLAIQNETLVVSESKIDGAVFYAYDLTDFSKKTICEIDSQIEQFSIYDNKIYYLTGGKIFTYDYVNKENACVFDTYYVSDFYFYDSGIICFYDKNNELAVEADDKGILLFLSSGKTIDKFTYENEENMELMGAYGTAGTYSVKIGSQTIPFSDYPSGSYFTDDGKACSSHSNCSYSSESACNCKLYYNGKNLLAIQCFGFARMVFYRLFGILGHSSEGNVYYSVASNVSKGTITQNYLKSLFQNGAAKPGSHIRTETGSDGAAHSLIFMGCDDTYFYTYEGNFDGHCQVGVRKRTWAEAASYFSTTKYGIDYIYMPKNYPGYSVDKITYASIENGDYYISNNGYYLNMAKTTESLDALNSSQSAANKTFTITKDGDFYIISAASGTLLNVWCDNYSTNGSQVGLYHDTEGDAIEGAGYRSQRWYFEECDGGYYIHPADVPSLYLTRDSSSNNIYVKTKATDTKYQIWKLESANSSDESNEDSTDLYPYSSAYKTSKYYTALNNVEMTGDEATDLVNVALSQVGYHEGNSSSELDGSNASGTNNYSEYGYWFGTQVKGNTTGHFYDWCAMFVSWCARHVGISTSTISNSAYAGASNEIYHFSNLSYFSRGNGTPKKGDLIFFDNPNVDGQWDHVGIVESVTSTQVKTIEGNAGEQVKEKTYNLTDTYIQGYGRPNYKNVSVDDSTQWGDWSDWSTTKPTASDTVQVESKTQYGYYHYILQYSDGNCGAYPIDATTFNKIFPSYPTTQKDYHTKYFDSQLSKIDTLTYNGTTYNCYANTCCPNSYNYDNGSNASYFYNLGTRTVYRSRTKLSEAISVNSVTLNKNSVTLEVGATESLIAIVAPSNATNKTVTWTSSNPSVATVSNGVVTAKSAGTANITVTTADGNKTAVCAVTVNPAVINVTGVTLNKTSATLTEGETLTLTATVAPTNATNKNVTWTSSNTSVATVSSNGVVTAKSAGNANITVRTADGNKTAVCAVTVNPAVINVTGVTLNKTSATLTVGETLTLTATVAPTNATNKNVTWTSSNTSVATVSSNGVITAKSSGTATITATTEDGGYTATCTVNVTAPSEEVSFNIHAENASGRPGNSVTVPVKIENNPGIAVLSFEVKYNSDAMTLTGCSVGDVFEAGDITLGNIDKNPYTFFALCGTENRNGNGTVAYFTFEIADGCQAGEYDIEIIPLESYTIEEAALTFGTQNGTVTVRDFICGDATGDGILNRQDLLRLAKAFAGWDVEYDEAASDVTGDGTVNRQDLLRLAKYFAGWDVTLG